jgi:hypothetical protein
MSGCAIGISYVRRAGSESFVRNFFPVGARRNRHGLNVKGGLQCPLLGTDLAATVAGGSGQILWKGPARLDAAQTFVEIRLPRNVLAGPTFALALMKKDSGAALAYAYFRFR